MPGKLILSCFFPSNYPPTPLLSTVGGILHASFGDGGAWGALWGGGGGGQQDRDAAECGGDEQDDDLHVGDYSSCMSVRDRVTGLLVGEVFHLVLLGREVQSFNIYLYLNFIYSNV